MEEELVRLREENTWLRGENERLRSQLEEVEGMLRSAKEEMKGEMKESEERMEERIDKKLEGMMKSVEEMMKGRFRGGFGEGAVGGRSSGTCEGAREKEKEEEVNGSVSDESDVEIGSKKRENERQGKEKGNEKQGKERRESKDKSGEEKGKKGKGKEIGKKGKEVGKAGKKGEGEGSSDSEVDGGEWIKVDKKRGKKSVMSKMNVSAEVDSLYSEEGMKGQSESSESESESEKEVRKAMYVREVPRCERYNEYGSRDVHDFFREYERFCQDKYGESKRVWARELGEYLTGFLLDMYRVIMSVGDVEYDKVKARLVEQARRILKASVKYKRKNEFDEVRMKAGETLSLYACRLETLARKKFGDDGIDECKELVRKLLGTVPDGVREFVNLKRKEKKRWTNERLTWGEILETVEDYELDRVIKESRSVSVRAGVDERVPEFGSFRDAVLRGPMRMADSVIDRSVRASNVEVPGRMNGGFVREQRVGRVRDSSVQREGR
ncbi:uncharacterized protein DDB_G0283697-like [Macrobrachium rosenbergii]|uniref:uncharacterized protein DDB_G0283697-like n=1 Tax=Macrobrachium rosenbergii TaxID=79674 RepID=UPI0034D5CF01